MFFIRKKKEKKVFPFPGERNAIDGHTAVIIAETLASEAAGMFPVPNTAQMTNRLRGGAMIFKELGSNQSVAGLMAGHASVGLRSTTFTSGSSLAEMHESLAAAVGKRLSYVINLTCRATGRQAESLHGGHEDYHSVADTGVFQLFAKNVQEAADFALIAHRIAELALNPGLVAQDSYFTSHSVQSIKLPDAELVSAFIGAPGDMIETPTAAQKLLFGEQRRRIPEWFDLDRPAGFGTVQDQDAFFKAIAAQRPFFFNHIAGLADQAFKEFGELTDRVYQRTGAYRLDDAELVIVAQGSIVEDLEAVVDHLRQNENLKVGVINLTMFRPFPGDLISKHLQGKKAATVLERVDQPLAEDLPLMREIRCAIDKAMENGAAEGQSPYPGHASYSRLTDRPQLFSGIYGIGGRNPSFSELVETVRNMTPAGARKKMFYLGARFKLDTVRYPKLETLQQTLQRNYPGLDNISITKSHARGNLPTNYRTFQLHSIAGSGGTLAGTLLAKTLSESLQWNVKTYPEYGPNQSMQPTVYTIVYAQDGTPRMASDEVDAILVSNHKLLQNEANLSALKTGGSLIFHSEQEPQAWWKSLSDPVKQRIRDGKFKLYRVNAHRIAEILNIDAAYGERMANQALIGAFLKVSPDVKDDDLQPILGHYRRQLEYQFESARYLVEDNFKVLAKGTESVEEIDLAQFGEDTPNPIHEPEPVWTVQEVKKVDGTVFDLARFWDSVGYYYETGKPDQTLPDPYVATGVIPARSSAFRDMGQLRSRLPHLLTDKCTGCGLCFTHCPDSAMPATVHDLGTLINAAVKQCQAKGEAMIQMQRITDHLAKQAHKMFAKDHYPTAGALLKDAFAKLIDLMGLKGDQLDAVQSDFNCMLEFVADFPIVRTEKFFDTAEKATKGSGAFFSLTINPMSCKECNLCVSVCPENALEMVDQTPEMVQKYHRNWDFLMSLPEISPDHHVDPDDPATLLNQLLNKKVYHSLVGGDGAFPGSGMKTAVHLVTGTVEAVMHARFQTIIDRLDELSQEIQEKIQGKVEGTLRINDFELFARKLSQIQQKGLDLKSLAEAMEDEAHPSQVSKEQLERLTHALDEVRKLRDVYVEGNNGDGRSRLAMTLATGSMLFWGGTYPYNPFAFPWAHHQYDDGPALALGLYEGVMRKMAGTFKTIRMAELVLQDNYRPDEHDEFFEGFGPTDLTKDEEALCPPLLVSGGDGAMSDRGFEGVSALLKTDLPIKIVVIDNQGFGATGGQANTASFSSARQDDHPPQRKELGLLAMMQRDAFVLQTSVGYPGHLIEGIRRGLKWSGPAFFHIYAPEPPMHGIAPDQVAAQAKWAVDSRAFPLFQHQPGMATLNLGGNPGLEADWLTRADIDAPDADDLAEQPFTFADWALRESRFKHNFTFVARGEWHDRMTSLAEFLQLDAEQRELFEPFVEYKNDDGEIARAVVSEEMVQEVENRLQMWHFLQELAGIRSTYNEVLIERAKTELSEKFEAEKDQLISEYDTRLRELDANHGQIYYQRLSQKLLAYAMGGQDQASFQQSVRAYLQELGSNGD